MDETLSPFQTFGWTPNDSLREDLNFLDLVLLLTRNAKLKDGGMACLIVKQASESKTLANRDRKWYADQIVSAANNQGLFNKKSSDIHAEIVAVGQAARYGRSTDRCTAYITMPPCKRCFGALLCAGISRIVTIRKSRDKSYERFGDRVEMLGLEDEEYRDQRQRVQDIVDLFEGKSKGDQDAIAAASDEKKRKREQSENSD